MVAWLLGLACVAAPEGAAPEVPCAPGIDWSAPAVEPVTSVDDIDQTVTSGLDEGLVHPLAVREWFFGLVDALSAGGDGCPPAFTSDPRTTVEEAHNWRGHCEVDDLTVDGGWVTTYGHIPGAGGKEMQWAWLVLSFAGTRADGGRVEGGGQVISILDIDPSHDTFYLELNGTFLDEGDDGPLAHGVSAGGLWQGRFGPNAGGLQGTFEGPLASGDVQLNMTGITLDPSCGDGPTGQLQLRDPGSGWWTVAFDDDCSGCGTVAWGNDVRGETCIGGVVRDRLTSSFAQSWGVQ